MPKLFRVGQKLVLRDKTGKILILKSREWKDWTMLGGRLEEGESWIEGLKREVREEIGIDDFAVTKILGVSISSSGATYFVSFEGRIDKDAEDIVITLDKEHTEFAWINPKDVRKYKFIDPGIKQILKNIH